MRPLILRIVLTLTCLVAPALLGVGDRAIAGVITIGTSSEIGINSLENLSQNGRYSWDLIDQNSKTFNECSVSAVEDDFADKANKADMFDFQANTPECLGHQSTFGGNGTRLTHQENDSIDGIILHKPTLPVLSDQNPRRIHNSDQDIPEPVLRDLNKPPRV